jgi:putative molybdopterin biosynthesis protein
MLDEIRLLTMADVAKALGVSRHRAYELGRKGMIPLVRLGRTLRVDERKLVAIIEDGGCTLAEAAGS